MLASLPTTTVCFRVAFSTADQVRSFFWYNLQMAPGDGRQADRTRRETNLSDEERAAYL
jgi:hypothetical protein